MRQLFITLLLLSGVASYAQNIDDEKVVFKYTRLPSEPIDKTLKSYTSGVELAFAGENAQKMAEYEQKVKEAEEQYEKDMLVWKEEDIKAEEVYQKELAEWKIEDEKAEQVYQKELEEYNKKSSIKKLADKELHNEGKPTKRSPQKPYKKTPSIPRKNLPEKPEIQKAYDTDLLANTYVKLQGFNKAADNAVVVTVTLYGFECLEPELITVTKSELNSTGKAYNQVNYYHYETKYKYPMSVKVEVPGKGVIYSESFTKLTEFSVAKTNSAKNSSFPTNKESYRKSLEDKVLADNLKYIDTMVNNRFGYVPVEREIKLYTVKKEEYIDYKNAFDDAMAGYRILSENKAGAQEKLKAAIARWESAMAESDPENKKARVDEDVTIITIINLMEAYMWMDDYANAEKYLDKFNTMDASKKQKKYVNELEELMKLQKTLYTTNNQ